MPSFMCRSTRSYGVCAVIAAASFLATSPTLAQPEVTQAKANIASLSIDGELTERPPEAGLFGDTKSRSLFDVLTSLRAAGDDPSLHGVVIRLHDVELSSTQAEEIAAAVRDVRSKGKKVHLVADSYSASRLVLGAACDDIIAQQGSPVSLPGLYMEEMFLADTLNWAGIKAEWVQVGDYKGANEKVTRTSPSKQWSENIDGLLDSIYTNTRGPIMRGREMTDAQLDTAMEQLWMGDAAKAKQLNLIDTVIDLSELTTHLTSIYGKPVAWRKDLLKQPAANALDMNNPFSMLMKLGEPGERKPTGPTIAIVHIDGAIDDGESSQGGMFGGETVGSRTIRAALEDIRKEDDIRGVVVRIDSPGGSATASEVIWQGVSRLAESKPVWVSIGGMAASGGYYVAAAGQRVYVNPSSIVGSIGVVGGKLTLEGLYDKLNVKTYSRARGPRAEMFASNKSWSDDQRDEVRANMTESYKLFTSRVAQGRKGIDLAKTAEGRVFTGDRAVALKMADAIGGLDVAVRDLAQSINLDSYNVMHFPAPRPFTEILEEKLSNLVKHPATRAPVASTQWQTLIESLVGKQASRQLQPQLNGLMQLREGKVLYMNPSALIFRD